MYEGTRKQWRGDRPRQHFPRARCSPVPFFFFLLRRFSSGGFYNEPQRLKQSPEVPKAMHALSPSRHGRASLPQSRAVAPRLAPFQQQASRRQTGCRGPRSTCFGIRTLRPRSSTVFGHMTLKNLSSSLRLNLPL